MLWYPIRNRGDCDLFLRGALTQGYTGLAIATNNCLNVKENSRSILGFDALAKFGKLILYQKIFVEAILPSVRIFKNRLAMPM
jgi:hypothetical protein